MKSRFIPVLIVYLIMFVAANLIVKHFGSYGLFFSSFFLIPFDFVARCYFHEKMKGSELIIFLTCITSAAACITVVINKDALNIADASVYGFACAQFVAGIVYQLLKKKSWLIKVNVSDLFAIIADSFVFQYFAFSVINPTVTFGQVVIKFAGGLLWYYILFKRLKIQDHI